MLLEIIVRGLLRSLGPSKLVYSVSDTVSSKKFFSGSYHNGVSGKSASNFAHEVDEVLAVPVGHVQAYESDLRNGVQDRLHVLEVLFTRARRHGHEFEQVGILGGEILPLVHRVVFVHGRK